MKYVNWDAVKARYHAYWAMENHDRPLYAIRGWKDGRPPAQIPHTSLDQLWFDTGRQVRNARAAFDARVFGGEALPILCPDLGPDIFGAILGADLVFGEDTSWAVPPLGERDWETFHPTFDAGNRWLAAIDRITADMLADAAGDYLVGFADWHPGCDTLAALFGPEGLSLALLEQPGNVTSALNGVFDVYVKLIRHCYELVRPSQEGTTHWMGLWHPGLWYSTSCDFQILISNALAEAFVKPTLEKELELLDASIFHLDGPNAFRHIDWLVTLERLHGIQVVPGAGAPPALHWMDLFQKIQRAGKGLQIACFPSELNELLEGLAPEGVFLSVYPEDGVPFTGEDVERLSRKIETYRR